MELFEQSISTNLLSTQIKSVYKPPFSTVIDHYQLSVIHLICKLLVQQFSLYLYVNQTIKQNQKEKHNLIGMTM